MSLSTLPLWNDALAEVTGGSRMQGDVTCEVCIVGGGIAGLTTAYCLAREGRRVVVLEGQREIGQGETGATTAHLASILDDRFARLESIRGRDVVRAAHASHAAAIDFIERTANEEKIDCDFQRVDGFLFAADAAGHEILAEEARVCSETPIRYDWCDTLPWPGHPAGPVLLFPNQAQFHPRRYLLGLAAAIRALGGAIFTETRVDHLDGPNAVTSAGHTVRAAAIVLATNTPINSGVSVNARIASYSTYVIAAEIPAEDARTGLYWDTQDPYHYVRFHAEDDRVFAIVGGEDHKTGQARDQADRYGRLEAWARTFFPRLGPVRHRWDGQVFETLDGLALIGPDPSAGANVFIATGDSGMGLTHGTLAGLILTDAIQSRANRWADLYDPSRLPIAAAGTLLRENANVAGQYLDWFRADETPRRGTLAPGEGVVVRHGLGKIAVCCTESGETHVVSAVCPHLGGIVHWNAADQTWDCACHGSRFTAEGHVVHGPATTDLKRKTVTELDMIPATS